MHKKNCLRHFSCLQKWFDLFNIEKGKETKAPAQKPKEISEDDEKDQDTITNNSNSKINNF